jgi:3-isopropylmalate/(R)-2-methylmalate dehydratase small subunit
MKPFGRLSLPAVSLRMADVDTDQIVPARFLFRPRATGFGEQLFHDLRFDESGTPNPDFVLNRPRPAAPGCLITGPNFGCGSSRESAVWALSDYGIRCVIGPSFGDIFYNNCQKNGLLPIVLDEALLERWHTLVQDDPGATVVVDLPAQTVALNGAAAVPFTIDPFRKRLLVAGKDDIALTLDMLDRIEAFEATYRGDFDSGEFDQDSDAKQQADSNAGSKTQ